MLLPHISNGSPTMSKRCITLLLAVALAGCGGGKAEHSAVENPSAPATPRACRPTPRPNICWRSRRPVGSRVSKPKGPASVWSNTCRRNPTRTNGPTKLSFESFSDPPLPDPIEMLKSIAADQRKTCTKFSDHETFSGVENDYPTSVRLFICSENPLTKKGQLTLVKTITRRHHFFVITRAKRVEPIGAKTRCRCRRK